MSAIDKVFVDYTGSDNYDADIDNDARAELAQLRADLAAQAAERDAQARQLAAARVQIALLDDYAETVRQHEITIAVQAEQLRAARDIISGAKNDYQEDIENGIDSYDKGQRCIDWLASTAPAPVRCQCVCGCDKPATTTDEHGKPLCDACYRDYYGIAPAPEAEQEQTP